MEMDGKRQAEAHEPGRHALGRMRGAVVQDEMQAAHSSAPDAAEEQLEEALELNEALALETASHGLAGVHQQGGEQLHGAPALIAVWHMHRAAGPRRGRAAAGLPGLDGRLLIRADDKVALPGQPLGALVEAQDGDGAFQKAWVGWPLPAVVLPRFDAVGPEPAPDGAG
jgi:predicted amidohydrolase YtcJ